MIQSIVMENFQPHVRKVIKFDRRITCLVGDTDQGKSSTMRALYWAAMNRPSGNWMLKHGTKLTRVKLTLDDCKVVRRKGKSNLYYLDGKKYKSFGAGKVPEDVSNALKLGGLNFQMQGEGGFWFNKTPGEVSKELNQIVDLEVIDTSLANIQRTVRQAQAEASVCLDRLDKAKEEKRELDWVPEVQKKLEELTERENSIALDRRDGQALSSLIEDVAKCRSTLQALKAGQCATNLLTLKGEQLFQLRAGVETFKSLIRSAREAKTRAGANLQDVSKLQEFWDDIVSLRERRDSLQSLVNQIRKDEQCLAETKAGRDAATSALRAIKACPLCGSPVKNLK